MLSQGIFAAAFAKVLPIISASMAANVARSLSTCLVLAC
jgi:hypothetical protein